MKPISFMLIAGEASGDLLAAELVTVLRAKMLEISSEPTDDAQPLRISLAPKFFGAGGPRMAAAGVELALDMTKHSVVGLSEPLKHYFKFRRLFNQLLKLTIERQPDAIVCVDFSGFNRRFAHAVKNYVRARPGCFNNWNPKVVQYVSPQVWASRPGRAYQLAKDFDLLLSIFPFEKAWYAARVPKLPVEFVGHPIVDRYVSAERGRPKPELNGAPFSRPHSPASPNLLLLPGSRADELNRHLPVMLGALEKLRAAIPNLRARMVLPDTSLVQQARVHALPASLEIQAGGLAESLALADVAIASTGTVTMECARFGVPTVAIYKTSWFTFQIAKHIVHVKYAAMPNLLANEEISPEFIQDAATLENVTRASLELLRDETRRGKIKVRFGEIIASLGGPGASQRAAAAITKLLNRQS